MADNYLERRASEIREGSAAKSVLKAAPSLESLLRKNRTHRKFDPTYILHRRQLETIVRVNTLIASGMNAQRLRFRIVDSGSEGFGLLQSIPVGAAIKNERLTAAASGFIVVCAQDEDPIVLMDLGISLQSMGLKAVELGLNALIIRGFDRPAIKDALGLPYTPLAILAIGKGAEEIRLVPVHEGESLKYWIEDGVHYVPKLTLEDITF